MSGLLTFVIRRNSSSIKYFTKITYHHLRRGVRNTFNYTQTLYSLAQTMLEEIYFKIL